MMDHKS